MAFSRGGAMLVQLTKDRVATIDDSDQDLVSKYNWTFDGRYPATYINGKKVRLHRLLLAPKPDELVDHINMNELDNRRSNLRLASKSQNMANRGNQVNNISGYKGVHKRKDTGRWQSYIKYQGKRIHLGYFATAEEAAYVYDQATIQLFGEFGRTNIL